MNIICFVQKQHVEQYRYIAIHADPQNFIKTDEYVSNLVDISRKNQARGQHSSVLYIVLTEQNTFIHKGNDEF